MALVKAVQDVEKRVDAKLAKRLPTKAQKRKLAGVTENNFMTIYRKFSGRAADARVPQMWNRTHGTLVLTPDGNPDPYIDPVSHRPYYHMDWSEYVYPSFQYHQLIGETDTLTGKALPNIDYWSGYAKVGGYASTQLQTSGNDPYVDGLHHLLPVQQIGGLEGDNNYEEKFMDPHKDRIAYYGYREKKIDLLPIIFHRKQLEGLLETDYNDNTTAQQWGQVIPSRLTDSVRINQLWLKFDFDTKFAGDEGTRNNVFTADTQHNREIRDTTLTNDWNGYRKDIEYNNRISNMYAKVRVIIGKRTGEIGKTAAERVSLNHVLKADNSENYSVGHSNEEVLLDLFTRGPIKRQAQSGIAHSNSELDEYAGIKIIKDEIIKLGKGHSTKHFNLFKGHQLKYMLSDNNENQINDIYTTEFDAATGNPPTEQALYDRFCHIDIKDAQMDSTDMEIESVKADKLCIPLKNDMFMYVLTLTRGASVRWRISSKLTYSSV